MKHGGEYAKRLKRFSQQLVKKAGKEASSEPTDPIEQLIVGILAGCSTLARAQQVYRRLSQQMVDLNELRVTPPMELAEAIGDGVPLAREKAQRIVDALNAIRRRQDSLDLTFLKQRGRREAREYLESLEGIDRAAAASVVLYSLGGHAIPVDDLTLYVLRKDGIIEEGCEIAEAQGFLERHIAASDARAFAEGLSRHVAARGARVPFERLGQLLGRTPPPPPPPKPQIRAPEPEKPAPAPKAGTNKNVAKAGNEKPSAPAKTTPDDKSPRPAKPARSAKRAVPAKAGSGHGKSAATAERRVSAVRKKK